MLFFFGLSNVKGTGASAQPCSFRRFSGKDLVDEMFGGKPEWFRLGEDRVRPTLSKLCTIYSSYREDTLSKDYYNVHYTDETR